MKYEPPFSLPAIPREHSMVGVGGFMESQNFVSGTSGWRLTGEGNFEGNDGTFRGSITGSTGTFTGSLSGADITGATGTFSDALDAATITGGTITGSTIAVDETSGYFNASGTVSSLKMYATGAAAFIQSSSPWSEVTGGLRVVGTSTYSQTQLSTMGMESGSTDKPEILMYHYTDGEASIDIKLADGSPRIYLHDTSAGTNVVQFLDTDAVYFGNSTSVAPAVTFYDNTYFYGDLVVKDDKKIVFEGSIDDGHETWLGVINPTADRTITLPDVSGQVVTTGNLAVITSVGSLSGLTVNGTANCDYLTVDAQGGNEGGEIFLAAAPSGGAAGYLDVFFGSLRVHDGGTARMDLGLSTGDLWIQNSIRTDTGLDGGLTMRRWTAGSTYTSLCTYNMTGQEYNMLTDGTNTFISTGTGGSLYLRPSANSSADIRISTSGVYWNATLPVVSGYRTLRRRTSDNIVGWDGSSQRYKENIVTLQPELWQNIYNLRPVTFDWLEEIHGTPDGRNDEGLIAEEVHETLPELVDYDDDLLPSGVQYEKLSVYLLAAVQSINERLATLEA
jgi:hypothetical protein